MRPTFEQVTIEAGTSWTLLDRRLKDGIPFEWHHHPEFELTLSLNSRGHRLIGDHTGSAGRWPTGSVQRRHDHPAAERSDTAPPSR